MTKCNQLTPLPFKGLNNITVKMYGPIMGLMSFVEISWPWYTVWPQNDNVCVTKARRAGKI